MKLYVWCDPYIVRYGSSMVIAVAESLEDAKLQAEKGCAYSFGRFVAITDKEKSTPQVLLGEPTRIVDLPCAEWHEWEE